MEILEKIKAIMCLSMLPLIFLATAFLTSAIDMWSMARFVIGLGIVILVASEFVFVLVTGN